MADHVDILISISTKYAVFQLVGYIKVWSAIDFARVYGECRRNIMGHNFGARGYFLWAVERDETMIREYIRHQEAEDRRLDQTNLWR